MRRALVGLVAVGLLATACGGGTAGTPTAPGNRKASEPTTTSRAPFDGETIADGEVVKAEVPADLTKATLTIAPTTFNCADGGFDYAFTTVENATVALGFPEK